MILPEGHGKPSGVIGFNTVMYECMEIPGNTFIGNAPSAVELHQAMLRLWDRMRDLASQPDPSNSEISLAIDEFSMAWQLATGAEIEDNSYVSGLSDHEPLPRAFARLLYKRLRLQFLEFSEKKK